MRLKALTQDLDRLPDVELNSHFPNTIRGFLPFQVRAYNFLKDLDSGIMLMSTGVGKSCVSAALIKKHLQDGAIDYAIFCCKNHNKVNTQRIFSSVAGIDSIVIDGPLRERQKLYESLLGATAPQVLITNYEKLRIDYDSWKKIFERRILIFFDEAPTKLKHRDTKLYRSIRNLIYKKSLGELRSPSIKRFALTATPIENSPEDHFNVVRLLDPKALGSIADFYNTYVSSFNPFSNQPQSWKNLDLMGKRTAHMTYRVDKSDPEIAKQFPKVLEEKIYIDWDPSDYEIYEKLSKKSHEIFAEEGMDSVLPLIMLMQMMCDMPSTINRSAKTFEAWEASMLAGNFQEKKGSAYAKQFVSVVGELYDDRHTKIDTLRELILEAHPNEKILVFSSFNRVLLPYLSIALDEWDVKHVVYTGNSAQKQEAQDSFQRDDNIRVFLSSDAGSDSINLEQASVVINLDLPWKFATKIQRENRAHRITSTKESVHFYTLLMDKSVDLRKDKILQRKHGYYKDIFDPGEVEGALSADDLKFILGVSEGQHI